ncbi:hypothetical protein MKEN_00027000 [Mycena kentingensis (nom. inval.)]|nr:hypothetical protein MKEN_00027000 [Mycena kentingensis (nom. inval.)]
MPVVGPALPPPPPPAAIPQPPGSSKTSAPTMPPIRDAEEQRQDAPESPVITLSLPLDSLSAALSSALAAALVSHTLFLKSQIPFPVVQLSRLPSAKSAPRALKLRNELLSSFDTLSSHLDTTFSALSTALALSRRNQAQADASTCRAELAILVGPSIASAKARVVFVVDGLALRVWGERDDADEEDSDEDSEGSEEEDSDGGSEPPESDSEDEEEDKQPSRSPSPSTEQPLSQPPTPTSRGPHAPRQLETEIDSLQSIQRVTRQLAQAMAGADCDLAEELSPTQTHILLHAPRRFKHPAWIPRQNASSAMQKALDTFWDEANGKKRTSKQKVEGVWVRCRAESSLAPQSSDEEDEMIWWSWDGKIVGFSEW